MRTIRPIEVDLIPLFTVLVLLFQCIAKLLLGQKASVLKYSNPTKWFIIVLTSSPLKSDYKRTGKCECLRARINQDPAYNSNNKASNPHENS